MSEVKDSKDLLKEILKWIKFTGFEKVRQLLETGLDTDSKKLVYEYSNGMSSPEIEQITGVDETTVRDYWKEWAHLGLVELHSDYKKRYYRIFSLSEFGVEIPKVKVKAHPKGDSKKEIESEGEKNE
jgi:Fic family protein